jgi:ribosomal protein RSM22 (predicted rRNA methylase)
MSIFEARQHVENGVDVPAYIVEGVLAEYAAVVAERDALREALTGMVAQHGCDCGHPHCNRCAETRECKAALAQGEVGNG